MRNIYLMKDPMSEYSVYNLHFYVLFVSSSICLATASWSINKDPTVVLRLHKHRGKQKSLSNAESQTDLKAEFGLSPDVCLERNH